VFALLLLSHVAAAQDVVRLSIPDCESAPASEIVKLVTLELAPQVAIALDAAEAAQLTASLECSDDRALITVQDARRSEPLQLALPLADTRREARPRLLALAIAELIATSRLEPGATPPPPPPPPPEPVAPAPERPFSLGLGAGVVYAFDPALWSPSLQLAAAYDFGSLQLLSDVELDWGSRSTSQASLETRAVSLDLAAGLRVISGDLAWHVGLGLRAGVVWLSAIPLVPELRGVTFSGIFLAPNVWTALQLRLTQRWFLRLAFELGYVTKDVRGLDADQQALLELSGLRVASWLGVGIRF